jgi:hypothetical protein
MLRVHADRKLPTNSGSAWDCVHLVTFGGAKEGAAGTFATCQLSLLSSWTRMAPGHLLVTGEPLEIFLLAGVRVAQGLGALRSSFASSVAVLRAHLAETSASEIMSIFDPEKLNELGIYDALGERQRGLLRR